MLWVETKPMKNPFLDVGDLFSATAYRNKQREIVFFRVAYILCVSPFKISLNGSSPVITTWIPQQVTVLSQLNNNFNDS